MMTLRQALLSGRRRPRRRAEGSPLQYRGDGYEFVELREYVQGDDVRRIDWAASARSAQLQTRVLLEDVALTIALYADRSASMQAGRSVPIAQAAAEIGETWLGAALRTDRRRVLASLDEAVALPRGAALLAVSDFFWLRPKGAHRDLLGFLAARYDCTALIARDPWQDELPLSGFVRVRDAETDDVARLFLGEKERARYRTASRAREADLLETLQDAGWRTGVFTENGGTADLHRAFGLA